MTGFDATRDDAAVVEFVDRLNRQAQRQFVERLGRRQRIERLDDGRPDIPSDIRRAFVDAVAIARGNRNDGRRRDAEANQMRGDFIADRLETFGGEIHPVHLVDDDRDLFDAEQMQQIAVTPGLVAHAFERIDDQDSRISLRCAGDHVAQKFRVARRIDQHDIARAGAETNLRGVDRDALIALCLQRIQQERPLERHAAPLADGFQHFEFAVGQAAGFVQQATNQCGLAVIDMADDDDADLRARGAIGKSVVSDRISRDGLAGNHIHGVAHFRIYR